MGSIVDDVCRECESVPATSPSMDALEAELNGPLVASAPFGYDSGLTAGPTPAVCAPAGCSRGNPHVRTIVRLAGLSALTLALAVSPAAAQTPPVPRLDLQRIALDPAARGSMLVGDGEVAPTGDYRFSAAVELEHEPLVLTSSGYSGNGLPEQQAQGAIVESRVNLHLGVGYTLWQRLEVSLRLPVVGYQAGRGLEQLGIAAPMAAAIAAPTLGLRYGILAQDDDREGSMPLSAAIATEVLTPWGFRTALAGQDSAALGARLELGRRFGGLLLAVQGGYVYRTKTIPILPDDALGNEVNAGLALATTGRLRVEGATLATFDLHNRRKNIIETVGLRYIVGSGRFDVFAVGGPGIGHLAGTPTWFGMVGLGTSGRAGQGPETVAAN
jgi:OmpA-OmpF porin, OOP family